MGLKLYQSKRDFNKTPEPSGDPTHSPPVAAEHAKQTQTEATDALPAGLFCVQKHAASRLHYDFRLELDGVLKSWAVPKGPCYNPKVKRLAVHVEDHPLDYARFEGVIPAAEYGGGAVIVWDEGTWHALEDPRTGLMGGKLLFELRGRKLMGVWTLVRLKKDERNWLLIKHHDAMAHATLDVVTVFPDSIISQRSIETVAKDAHAPSWHSSKGPKKRR